MMPQIPGIFAIDKPLHMSSARAVAIIKHWARRETGEKNIRVGHGGTLDPLATGVLVIAVGRVYTRQLSSIVADSKEYEACVRLGATSTTDDAEGEIVSTSPRRPSLAEIHAACAAHIGTVLQVPPQFSALKKNGIPLYKYARNGASVEITARPVEIMAINVCTYTYPDIYMRITCGKGTYIRSLARDLGAVLGTGAYLAALRRTRVGIFTQEQAAALSQWGWEERASTH